MYKFLSNWFEAAKAELSNHGKVKDVAIHEVTKIRHNSRVILRHEIDRLKIGIKPYCPMAFKINFEDALVKTWQ